PGTHIDSLSVLDKTLDAALAGVCVDQGATAGDAARSPYLNRSDYAGHFETETVERPASDVLPAEERGKAPVVESPAPVLDVPLVTDLPSVPAPAPTQGPTRIPTPAPVPSLPDAPAKPVLKTDVDYNVEDVEGPGCGWAFTAQVAPVFDHDAARASYDT